MRAVLVATTFAVGAAAAAAAFGGSACVDWGVNSGDGVGPRWTTSKELTPPGEHIDEPTPGLPEDPHQMLKRGIDAHPEMKCHLEIGTRNVSCIDSSRVRSNGDLRASELLEGRPERLRKTGLDFVVDCRKVRVALRDRNGTQFRRESPTATGAYSGLFSDICALRSTLEDASLRLE